jgi:hypothetical protein
VGTVAWGGVPGDFTSKFMGAERKKTLVSNAHFFFVLFYFACF